MLKECGWMMQSEVSCEVLALNQMIPVPFFPHRNHNYSTENTFFDIWSSVFFLCSFMDRPRENTGGTGYRGGRCGSAETPLLLLWYQCERSRCRGSQSSLCSGKSIYFCMSAPLAFIPAKNSAIQTRTAENKSPTMISKKSILGVSDNLLKPYGCSVPVAHPKDIVHQHEHVCLSRKVLKKLHFTQPCFEYPWILYAFSNLHARSVGNSFPLWQI